MMTNLQYVSVKLVTITVQVLLWQEYHDQSAREKICLQVRLPRTGSGDATRHSRPCSLQVPVRLIHVQLPPFHQAELHEPTCRHPFFVRWVALLGCPNTSWNYFILLSLCIKMSVFTILLSPSEEILYLSVSFAFMIFVLKFVHIFPFPHT